MFREHDEHTQSSFFDADNLMTERSRKRLMKSWAVPFYRDVFSNINEHKFEPLFSHTGAPNTPVNILMSLELFKYMFSWSDDQLMDEYDFNYLVNYAVGNRQIGQRPMAEKTLYNFRSRCFQYLMEHPDEENPIFEQFLTLLAAYSKSAKVKMSEQRLDTTLFMSNMKKSGRLSLCFDVLELAVSAIPEKKRPEALAQVFDPEFRKSQLYKALPSEADNRLAILIGLCLQAKSVLEQEKDHKKLDAYNRLCRFIQEQTVIRSDGCIVPRENKDISPSSLQSAYDDGATFREKSGRKYSGYVAAISETCGKDNDIQLITDIEVRSNVVSDVALLKARQANIMATGAEHLYVDGGFHSASGADQDENLSIHYTNMSGTRPNKKMDAMEFDFDNEKHITQCPAGNPPVRNHVGNGQTSAHFELDGCQNCPMKDRCPAKLQKKTAVVHLSLKNVRAAEIRKDTDLNLVEYTSMRAAIEGTNSALKRTGMAKMKVRGQLKCKVTAIWMATAQNTKRLIRYWKETMKNEKLSTAGLRQLAWSS
jgi:hypothetical protein